MNVVIFQNRWLAWAIVAIVVVFIVLMWQIKLFEIEQDFNVTPDEIKYQITIPRR